MLNFYFIIKLLTHRINNFTEYILFITIIIYIPNNKNFPGILIAKNYSYAQYVHNTVLTEMNIYIILLLLYYVNVSSHSYTSCCYLVSFQWF